VNGQQRPALLDLAVPLTLLALADQVIE